MKACVKCSEFKFLSDFYENRRKSDGHFSKCKDCVKAEAHDRYRLKADQIRAYDRERNKTELRMDSRRKHSLAYKARHPDRVASSQRRRHDENPQKRVARAFVKSEIRSGRLTRKPCEECGKPKSEAHHEDYSKPLEVKWLCRSHHAARHVELQAQSKHNNLFERLTHDTGTLQKDEAPQWKE